VAYFQRAGQEEEYAHPHDGGDRCTAIWADETLFAALLAGDPTLPVATAPRVDLAQRQLASEEDGVALLAAVLASVVPARVAAGRPATAQARRRVAGDARDALAVDPRLGLLDLARAIAVSPHHLSRVFREEVGVSVSTYRRRLRVRAALERLSAGERDL